MLSILKQKQQLPEKVVLPSQKQLKTLQSLGKTLLNEDTLRSLMAWIMFIFCCLINGIRLGEEVANLNVEDLDLDEGRIRVHRKGGKLQWINFPKKYIPVLQRYLDLRSEYLKNRGYLTEKALFIKKHPNMGTHGRYKKCWRLKAAGFWRTFGVLRKGTTIEKMKPYVLRHYSCSLMVLNAKIFDIKIEQIAGRNDHSIGILEKFYDGALGNHHELYMRETQENIEFIKLMIDKSMKNLLNNPSEIEHLFCAIEWAKDLGKTQKVIELSEYSDSKNRNLRSDIGYIECGIQNMVNDLKIIPEVRAALPGLLSLLKRSPDQLNEKISGPQEKQSSSQKRRRKMSRL